MIVYKILSLCPATPGWRVVFALDPPEGTALEDAGPDDVLSTDEIACWALAVPEDADLEAPTVQPVVSHGDYMDIEDAGNALGILAPNDKVELFYAAATRYLQKEREKRGGRVGD
jgi:hypothetical protein